MNNENRPSVEEGLAATENEIQSLEERLKTLRTVRDAFLIVRDRLAGKPPEHHPELIVMEPNGATPRGAITQAIRDAVAQSTTAMSPRDVKNVLLRRGIRPHGEDKNFGITIAKTLKRLSKKELAEHKSGHSVTYTFIRTKRTTEQARDATLRAHSSNGATK